MTRTDLTPRRKALISFARHHILAVLERGVKHGQLQIVEDDVILTFGEPESKIPLTKATLHVRDASLWLRIFMTSDLGFAESFMLEEVEVDDLKAVCEIWLLNAPHLHGLSTSLHRIFSTVFKFTSSLFGQNISRARLNAIAGYDGSNTLFQAFLSQEMMYSCALWTDELGGVSGDLDAKPSEECSLEAAQKAKINLVLAKTGVRAGDRILEIGSGWCGFAIEAARRGCSVDTITLSTAQKSLGEARVRAAGLQHLVTVHLLDYRCLPPTFKNAFDAVVSIEMVEHVGTRHYKKYFQVIDWAMKTTTRSVAVISSSTMPESRYTTYQAPDFSRYYMWPNGALPSATALIKAANKGSRGRLTLQSVENHGEHYPRTLREWKRRFHANVWDLVQEQIIQEKPEFADPRVFGPFTRKWLYLFPSAEAGFESGYLGCHMLTFGRDVV
ncbi:CFS1-like protein [Roridomyces roridus]|uniref:CFS1-like protein n=1 Tax=Roridomyces roridus TaxID=1738132 RepID=A0AAD7BZ97_9AGAR|nr:CFS1-like protein [Roridomyces roridus]